MHEVTTDQQTPGKTATTPEIGDFEALVRAENATLRELRNVAAKAEIQIGTKDSAGLPWVKFTSRDAVGLAFSGGGIRSATFNLGLLQGLHSLKLLPHFDYLATVSGGGYIGSWWSTWLARRHERSIPTDQFFPKSGDGAEPEDVRHVREFGNFLAPRIGFFETETWSAALAVLTAMLPALACAIAVVIAGLLGWLALAASIFSPGPFGPAVAFGGAIVFTGALQLLLERKWCAAKKAEACKFPRKAWIGAALFTTAVFAWILCALMEERTGAPFWAAMFPFSAADALVLQGASFGGVLGGLMAGYAGTPFWAGLFPLGIVDAFARQGAASFGAGWSIFHVPFAWLGAAGVGIAARILCLRFFGEGEGRVAVNSGDRVLQRLLAMSLVWALLAGIWIAGDWVHARGAQMWAAIGSAISAAIVSKLRNWMSNEAAPQKQSGPAAALKPLIPQVLSYLAIGLGAIVLASLLVGCLNHGTESERWTMFWLLAAGAVGVVLFGVFFFEPSRISMHEFYRNRLARAYLGASNPENTAGKASTNRQVDLRSRDDIELRQLHTDREKIAEKKHRGPLHLVCCAANDTGGDQLGNLSRGGFSAVLSPLGFCVADRWRKWIAKTESDAATSMDRTTLASAVTASAAAFNSNMGSLSMTLGSGVTFLLTALNMRLGLWLPHPASGKKHLGLFPGWLFFQEMFGKTNSALRDNQPVADFVHLSDGAHFENLAIYELVRRHCRYILVSDCGADADTAFDDFGNAVRRIREDFGVEIEIDLAPLKPDAERISRQHIAIGSIYYDRDHGDTGVLIYVKPTLTGDEPADITQYRTRNQAFPHESTADQFYDEAQWESYRRLGEHGIKSALRFLERNTWPLEDLDPEDVFIGARLEWYPAPATLHEHVAEAAKGVAALNTRIREQGTERLQREIFPEFRSIEAAAGKVSPPRAPTAMESPTVVAEGLEKDLDLVLEMLRVMESVWLTCELDAYWSHPLNMGWVNVFQRWVYTPTFRMWWPVLKTMHGPRFRRFMEEQFELNEEAYPINERCIPTPTAQLSGGFASIYWERSKAPHEPEKTRDGKPVDWRFYPYVIHLNQQFDGASRFPKVPLEVGVARIGICGDLAFWRSGDFFVPPGLWGSGIGGAFIWSLFEELALAKEADKKTPVIKRLEVEIEYRQPARPPGGPGDTTKARPRTDIASRQEHNDLIAFYRRAGFSLEKDTGAGAAGGEKMVRTLGA